MREGNNKMTHLLSKLCNLSYQRAATAAWVKENGLKGNIKLLENLEIDVIYVL